MENYLPSYEEALEITNNSEAFYVQFGEVCGYKYALFNYRMAVYKDFVNEKWDARELRGLTFIYNESTSAWIRHIMLTKFWNFCECGSTQYDLLEQKPISSIENKEDGSLISFVVLPNGEVVPKTKMSFNNDQTKMVKDWMTKNPIAVATLKNSTDLTFLFELVSPKNKIVLKYEKTELRLLQIRKSDSGEYCDHLLEKYSSLMEVPLVKTFDESINKLIELKETRENIDKFIGELLMNSDVEQKFNTSEEFFRWVYEGILLKK